jgi:FkbM family methyltransferase
MKTSVVSILRPLVERFPRVASIYRGMRDQLAYIDEPIRTPWGFRLAGNSLMATGAFEPEETELIRKLLGDVDVLVNVGANVGYYCCHALSMGKAVIAFEPMQSNLRHLYNNIDANGWSCEIFPIALSNKIGILKMYGGGIGASLVRGWAATSDVYCTLVPCSTMNTVLGSRLMGKKVLIVVDVEGAEQWVLEGSSQMLANNPKPIWLIEITASEHQPRGVGINPRRSETFTHMFEAGYEAVTADKEMRLVTKTDVAAAQRESPSVAGAHNFLFR